MSPVAADWLSAARAPGAAPPCDAECDPDPPPHPDPTAVVASATQVKEVRRVCDMPLMVSGPA
jgi:hypothetical protein